ncbi:hypothetical protein TK0124 [Thermococcus kodakarensis KOD1]|uniref:Uncharacterized protein n=1 Tax=Thermococcus kodakarensis (strain ATCC BAA-918 / JCM 12380 / KOD1) TaxID=69014 RepID=Q5JFG0_THEKO|nr:hypothetical protein [Thermococcus kodakarensis]WCN30528.1 hypothetical protein POG21_00650 [Thermococcus kodakarensis]BAD84313.1 hypothetical protein TK0124 [Thermococcus kodakarensis KOD1]
MPCIHPPTPEKVKDMKEESFIREGKGKLKVTIEGEETLETTMNGSLKSVEEVAEMLGVEAKDGKIDTVVDGVKVRMQKGKLELEFESGEKMKIERA